MNIRLYPDPVLRKKAVCITDDDLEELVRMLVTAMINHGGIGIAAPQIGISKRAALLSKDLFENADKPLVLVNPRIIETSGEQSIEEGCLSVYGITADVPRKYRLHIENGPGEDRKIIELCGMPAIVAQHEIDHLDGVLFPDRLSFPRRYWNLARSVIKKKYASKD